MNQLYVKAEEIRSQLNGQTASKIALRTGMNYHSLRRFMRSETKFMDLDIAEKICMEFDLILPDEFFNKRQVQYPDRQPNCKGCGCDWLETNIECIPCLHRQLTRLKRSKRKQTV